MKKYMVYLDDSNDVYKIIVPAKSERKAREFCEGNGEIIAVKDVTSEYPVSADSVARALNQAGFGDIAIDLIVRALVVTNIAE